MDLHWRKGRSRGFEDKRWAQNAQMDDAGWRVLENVQRLIIGDWDTDLRVATEQTLH